MLMSSSSDGIVDGHLTLPNDITDLETSVYENNTEITSVSIPNSLTCINHDKYSPFNGCSSITKIEIPTGITMNTSVSSLDFYEDFPLTFTAEEENVIIRVVLDNSADADHGSLDITLETSIDNGQSWTPYTVGGEITLDNIGDKVMFRNSSDEI